MEIMVIDDYQNCTNQCRADVIQAYESLKASMGNVTIVTGSMKISSDALLEFCDAMQAITAEEAARVADMMQYELKCCESDWKEQDRLYSADYEFMKDEWRHQSKKHEFKQKKWSTNRPRR